ncbi:MAG: hypothetical protein RMK79_08970 [Anaerolineae bacterium]|nr:hypothetical protein [Anaerolineae bacterium]
MGIARTMILWALLALAGGLLIALYLPGSGASAQAPGAVSGQAIVPLQKLEEPIPQAQAKFGWSLALDGDYLVVGAPHYTATCTPDVPSGSAYIFRRVPGSTIWTSVKRLSAGDDQPCDWFGYAVAIDGDTVVVGAPRSDLSDRQDAGAVYVFRRDKGGSNNWGQATKLTATQPYTADRFGTAVTIAGDVIAVGAPRANVGSRLDAGLVYIFYRDLINPDQWAQGKVISVSTSDRAAYDRFGSSLALNNETLVVGAPQPGYVHPKDPNQNVRPKTGVAYVFERNQPGENQWGQMQKLVAPDGIENDQFGACIHIAGDTIAVGAHQPGSSSWSIPPGPGAAYVFERNLGGDDQWEQRAKLSAAGGAPGDHFGFANYVLGDTIFVGAYLVDEGGKVDQGAAYVFERNAGGNSAWGQTAQLRAHDGKAEDGFGFAVAAQGNALLVGAPYVNRSASILNAGAVYVFITDGHAVHLPVISR